MCTSTYSGARLSLQEATCLDKDRTTLSHTCHAQPRWCHDMNYATCACFLKQQEQQGTCTWNMDCSEAPWAQD